MANFGYLATKPGGFKIFTIVLGIVTFGLAIHGVYKTEFLQRNVAILHASSGIYPERYGRERELFLIWVAAITVVISLVYLLIHLVSKGLANNRGNKILDSFYHFIAALLLLVSSALMIYNTIELDEDTCRYLQYQFNVGSPYAGLGAFGNIGAGLGLGGFGTYPRYGYGHGDTELCRELFNFGQKLSAGVFGILNGIFYIIVAVLVLKSPQHEPMMIIKE